jgi:N-acetylmuramoyl-L-alanine amidase
MAWANDHIRDLVTRTLLGESDGSPQGMISVANVIKNRGLSGAWGQPNGGLTRAITAPKQFSMWNTDDPKLRALAAGVNAIPTTDPRYQKAAAVADSVFGDQIGDNTNGATHYHTPDVSPPWSQGVTPVATIGGHYFYKLPLTASNTAGTAVTSPSTVGMGGSSVVPAPAAPAPAPDPSASPIAPIQSFTGGDYGRQATAGAQPFKGIVIHIAGKPDLQSELAYNRTPDAGRGNAYYGYHYLIDRDGKIYQTAPDNVRTNHIMGNSQYGLNNENAIGVSFIGGAPAGQNPLPMTPEQQAAGVALVNQLKAKYNIDPSKIVSHGELDTSRIKGLNPDGGAEGKDFIAAYRASVAAPAAAAAAPATTAAAPAANPADVPAPQAQPVAATAPPGSPPTPASPQNPSAGFVGPGSDKYSVLQGMTTGTSHNPQLTTAANWGNLFGGSAPPTAAPPAAAPVAAPAQPATAPAAAQNPPGSPLSSIVPNFGASQPAALPDWVSQHPPGGGVLQLPTHTEGAPSMGYPAMTNPFGQPPAAPDQTSSLPGSMLASAQNLIKLLYPGVG